MSATVAWIPEETGRGRVRENQGCYDWLVRDQRDALWLLQSIAPYARTKARQVLLARQILERTLRTYDDLRAVAQMADTLSALNARSRGKRQHSAAMVQEMISRND